jgi:hypothetical protein
LTGKKKRNVNEMNIVVNLLVRTNGQSRNCGESLIKDMSNRTSGTFEGTLHEFTPVYSPALHGIAERERERETGRQTDRNRDSNRERKRKKQNTS